MSVVEDNPTASDSLWLTTNDLVKHTEATTRLKDLDFDKLSKEEIRVLAHGLDVNEMELEIQNEELREIQHKLMDSRDRYLDLFQSAPIGYLMLNEQGVILEANLMAADIIGSQPRELLGKKLSSFVDPRSQEVLYHHARAIFDAQESRTCVLELNTSGQLKSAKSQTEVRLESVVLKQPWALESIWRAAMIDVTERQAMLRAMQNLNKDLERRVLNRTNALRVSEAKVSAIIDAASDVILTVDEYGKVESANPAVSEMFGYTQEQLIGRNLANLLSVPKFKRRPQVVDQLPDTVTGIKGFLAREMMAQHSDGHHLPISLSISRIASLQRFVIIIRDMTARRRLEEKILIIAEQERARISRELHDGICQEVVGLSLLLKSMALKTRSGESTAETYELISDSLRDAVVNLRKIIYELAPMEIDGEELPHSLQLLAQSAKGLTAASCKVDCPYVIKLESKQVALQLLRIAQEAVHNALKHSNATEIVIRYYREKEWIYLEVVDNGVGFSDPTTMCDGFGIQIMRYRAGLINATLDIGSSPDTGGVSVVCRIAR